MSEPLVSVVTPVYNGMPHVVEAIDSVLGQTHRNLEYVFMDNSSTDGTLELARERAAGDPRMRVLAPSEFVSADDNANRALREISPEARYVKVLHGDDWLYPECLERMVAVAEASPRVAVVSAYRIEGDQVSLDGLPPEQTVVDGRECCRGLLLGRSRYLWGAPSNVLYRADVVRARPVFYNPENQFQSDQEACFEILRDNDLGFVHQVLTYTRRHEGAESPYYIRVGAYMTGVIGSMLRFGPVYLSQAEYERRLVALLVEYLGFLARRPWRFADQEFREFHVEQIRRFAGQIEPGSVASGVVEQLRRIVTGQRGSGR